MSLIPHFTSSQPLIKLENIIREFETGETKVTVLKEINLSIHAGEMVAIVGSSGSGKSTLMNILGCLDKPTSGTYQIAGRSTSELTNNELAQMRRERFGFIFQRYHLLPSLTALGNAEIPAIYAGTNKEQRTDRAKALLTRLGLSEKIHYRPTQLSGGQQQRVSIARALMNGGQIILADEPTGALDSQSGTEVLNILRDLHEKGHTIIIVTHDMQIAKNAQRIIEIKDGHIISDSCMLPDKDHPPKGQPNEAFRATTNKGWKAMRGRFINAFKMAMIAMYAQKLRTFLTMLGIIIGIAAVVAVVALGEGSKYQILKEISAIGTSTLEIFPGKDFGDHKASTIHTLRASDAEVLKEQYYIHSVTPSVSTLATFRVNNQSALGLVNGVGEQFFDVRDYQLAQGVPFNEESIETLAQEVVIDEQTRSQLFGGENPIGKIIILDKLPAKVIGVVKNKHGGGYSEHLNVWLPYTTVLNKMLGQYHLKNITVRVNDDVDIITAERAIERMLFQRHGKKDFYILNTDLIRKTIEQTAMTFTVLISMIAVISLLVGGIGVMNIMLVSVTERTKEIGVRMAVGARSSDIMQQFLIEAVLVCLIGGVLGICLSFIFGMIFTHLSDLFPVIYSSTSIITAFICSTMIGVLFGFFPARRAAQLDPIHALERE